MQHGFMYLVAILDWFSRYVLAWQLSNTLDGQFCLDALQQALLLGQPDIFNTDQGAQFAALAFTGYLEAASVRISMDGRGRVFDNISIERLWRGDYFQFYNHDRPHQSWTIAHQRRCILHEHFVVLFYLILAVSWS